MILPKTCRRTMVCLLLLTTLAPVAAQIRFGWMGKRHLPPNRDQVYAVRLADFDRDGDQDIFCGCIGQNLIFINRGSGRFDAAPQGAVPPDSLTTRDMVVADLNGDGFPDWICGNDGTNKILLNTGKGTYRDATPASFLKHPGDTWALALGDINGDGHPDLVCGEDRTSCHLYLNNGLGGFTFTGTTWLPKDVLKTRSLALVDVDGDGDLDLFIGGETSVRLLINIHHRFFHDPTHNLLPRRTTLAWRVATGDFNRDGAPDLVITGPGTTDTRLLLNTGRGRFVDAPYGALTRLPHPGTALASGDVNGDGNLDLVVGTTETEHLLFGDGKGGFLPAGPIRLLPSQDHTQALNLGDLDGDGDLDLLTGNILPKNPKGLIPHPPNQTRLLLNDGTGFFAEGTTTAAVPPVACLAMQGASIGDMDNDGDMDLVVNIKDQPDHLFLNTGRGRFFDYSASHMPQVKTDTAKFTLVDLDGDGDLDALSSQRTQHPLVYRNDGQGRMSEIGRQVLAPSMPLCTTKVWRTHACGDIDSDGDQDIIFASGQAKGMLVNQGKEVFTLAPPQTVGHLPGTWYRIELVDVDGDRDLDLVTQGPPNGVWVHLNQGRGVFVSSTKDRFSPSMMGYVSCLHIDVDGDGDPDMIITSPFSNPMLYRNDGQGNYSSASPMQLDPLGSIEPRLTAADVDMDGDLDVFVTGYLGAGQDKLFLNDGKGKFTPTTLPIEETRPQSQFLIPADLDQDGDPDLLTVSPSYGLRIATNLRRHIAAPYIPTLGSTYRLELHAQGGMGAQAVMPLFSTGMGRTPLPPFGTLLLHPTNLLLLDPLLIDPKRGRHDLDLPIPLDPTLAGRTLSIQGVVFDLGGRPTPHIRLTNALEERLIR